MSTEDTYKNIPLTDAKTIIDSGATIADIRDEASFAAGHINGAIHLSDRNLQEFILESDHELPLIVCCYHGHSSQPAAQYLASQGFEEVYSLIGGYTARSSEHSA